MRATRTSSKSGTSIFREKPRGNGGGRMHGCARAQIVLRGGSRPVREYWDAVPGRGHTESVSQADKDSLRVVPHGLFRVVLTPEPSRIDYQRHPEVLREWAWLLLPVRWGYPSAPSVGSEVKL